MCTDRRLQGQSGVSLVELIMFIVIIGVAVIAVVRVLSITSVLGADPVRRKQALAIAESLLEEVQLARFTFCDGQDLQGENALSAVVGADGVGCTNGQLEGPGRETGNVGRPFDNVNDYIVNYGVANTQSFLNAGVLSDANGNAMAGGYTASVTITATDNLGGITSGEAPASNEVLRITVRVGYENNQSVILDGYRTRYAPRSMP